jgi:hypothetical protein
MLDVRPVTGVDEKKVWMCLWILNQGGSGDREECLNGMGSSNYVE